MDILIYLKALLLGLVEGLTEFLPVSSTGHLIIVADLLKFTGENAKTFEIFIQLGAILAVCWYFRTRITSVVYGLPHSAIAQRFVGNLIIAFLPAAMLGLTFNKLIKEYLFNPVNVAIASIIGGLIILWIERRPYVPRVNSVDDMRWTDALKIGFCQALALFPGTSRSGATIMGGLFFGLSRQAATEFSFFLAIPTMFAATLYELYKGRQTLHMQDAGLFALGFFAAFISAFFVVKIFLKFIANHNFKIFAYYRIIFGMIALWYFW